MFKPYVSTRWKNFDYSSNNFYFITTVTKNRLPYFGFIENNKMHLNQFGQCVKENWLWLEEQYSYVNLHEFVIMPDHFHGIIEIKSDQKPKTKIKPLSELIGAFKTKSSKQIHLNKLENFRWQRSFHDRVIRNQNELMRITKYIQLNPENYVGSS